ncbi:hypothetical protein JAAARDRAFT_28412 [Jaapia argillacea MUCL 33604]|uniref:Transcription initiation factor TFIID subunit 8 n=1 Tax=Jaapia argillacea MUCL 33604 TaxID=933084 RepID=A0A067QCR7_9AGAM|nr:hypothetical protein JAAARDRAFT_28412 [Jaapia argillacea MUCL 33604]
MSNYTQQSYASYSPSQYGTAYPDSAYYASQYSPAAMAASYSSVPPHIKSSPPPQEPPPPPDLSSVSTEVASHALQRQISAQLRAAGFDSAEPIALQRLELEVTAFFEQLYHRAHEYANLANRAKPIAKDLLLANQDVSFETKELHLAAKKSNKRRREGDVIEPLSLLPPPPRPSTPDLLPSDDEGAPIIIPATLRGLPYSVPELPPKHTYLRTPPSPPKRAAPSSLEKKLKTAGLVQESLKNLLIATEDTTGQEDGELLGHIVNWEAHVYPRKRWKVGS